MHSSTETVVQNQPKIGGKNDVNRRNRNSDIRPGGLSISKSPQESCPAGIASGKEQRNSGLRGWPNPSAITVAKVAVRQCEYIM
jgi:hypothetical protein